MTTSSQIVSATMEHAAELAPRLRALDFAEIESASGHPVIEVLAESVERAVWAEALLIDGRVEAVGGLRTLSMMFGPGVAWLVGSDRLTERKRWFLSQSRRQVGRMLGHYDRLLNWVDARNRPAARYLRGLGFSIGEAAPWGAAGLPFHPFSMERAHV